MKTNLLKENKKANLKDAVVEQIILWIVIFVSFVGFLFFIIDYSNVVKVKENADSIGDYTAKMLALSKNDADIVLGINKIKGDYITSITTSDLICVEDNTVLNHQVIVNIYATLNNGFLPVSTNNIHSKTVVFNESSEFEKECTITLSFN